MGADFRDCAIPGCAALIGPEHLMCERHWKRVPKHLRQRIGATRGKQRSAAVVDAIESVLKGVRV